MEENKKKILLVDDEKDLLDLVTMRLENTGYEVLPASGGRIALELLKDKIPDLVLLDIVMPDMDGIEVCRQIRKMKYMAAVPVIFLTARSSIDDKIIGLKEGANDYITKPFDTRELLARIEAVIGTAERNKEVMLRDELTGLYNYNFFKEAFSHYFNIAKRYGRVFSMLLLDIDNFKKINDSRGHLCGNAVLEAISNKLMIILRKADVVTRYGGDEFAVILPETGASKIDVVAGRLKDVFKKFEVDYRDEKVVVGVSIGTSTYADTMSSKEELFDIADKNMYAAKEAIKNEDTHRR